MSQRLVSDPSAFERANYIKMLEAYNSNPIQAWRKLDASIRRQVSLHCCRPGFLAEFPVWVDSCRNESGPGTYQFQYKHDTPRSVPDVRLVLGQEAVIHWILIFRLTKRPERAANLPCPGVRTFPACNLYSHFRPVPVITYNREIEKSYTTSKLSGADRSPRKAARAYPRPLQRL